MTNIVIPASDGEYEETQMQTKWVLNVVYKTLATLRERTDCFTFQNSSIK